MIQLSTTKIVYMRNLIYTLAACAVHVLIHQIARNYIVIDEAFNRNLLYAVLTFTFLIGFTYNLKTQKSAL